MWTFLALIFSVYVFALVIVTILFIVVGPILILLDVLWDWIP